MTWAILRVALRWAITILGEAALDWSVRQLVQAVEQQAPAVTVSEAEETYIWEECDPCQLSE